MERKLSLPIFSLLFSIFSFSALAAAPKHEMRGAWVATVFNIDWPSKAGTSPQIADLQRRELCQLLDTLQAAGLNAVLLQVRPMADALYASSMEPWSEFLTGERGAAPAAGWDPLAFAVEQAHQRGMELHAWVNPFRLSKTLPLPSTPHDLQAQKNGWVLTYAPKAAPAKAPKGQKGKKGNKGKGKTPAKPAKTEAASVLDPGNLEARGHIVNVCREIVHNYDIDGLVFDDYFYPDRLPEGAGYDYDEYLRFLRANSLEQSQLSQADWRRGNVNTTIADVYTMIQKEKPWVRFGVSPAGVGGGNGKATAPLGLQPPKVGSDWMYDRIYCNPLDWLAAGNVDYVSPQIYWATDHATNPYEPLAQWWGETVGALGDRHFYPSRYIVKNTCAHRGEHARQTAADRAASPQDQGGSILYSASHLTGRQSQGLTGCLREDVYQTPALMPAMTWKPGGNPGKISKLRRKGNWLHWRAPHGARAVVYAVPSSVSKIDALSDDGMNFLPDYIVGIAYGESFLLPSGLTSDHWYAVAPYDRYGREWPATTIRE